MAFEGVRLTKKEIVEIENRVMLDNYVRQYIIARRFVWGNVMDIACGCGYGTYLLAKNPDVSQIVGVDSNSEAAEYAVENFASKKITFRCCDLKRLPKFAVDVFVSLEIIEHLENPRDIFYLADRFDSKELLISFSRFKTTHLNPEHKWDLTIGDLSKLAEPNFYLVWREDLLLSTLVRFVRTSNQPTLCKRFLS